MEDFPLDSRVAQKLKAITDTLVECCKCNNRFNDPRVIPCGHTICLSCLQEHTSDLTPGSTFSCPRCNTRNVVPEGGVEIFAKNLLVTTLGELIQKGESDEAAFEEVGMVCINSEPDKPHGDVVTFCTECVERFCEECDAWHSKAGATRGHSVMDIGDLDDQQLKAAMVNAVVPKCERHGEKITLHCNHCKVSICTVCANSGHKGHDIEDLASAAVKRRTFLSRAQGSASEYVDKVEKMREAMAAIRTKADEDREMALKWVDHTCSEIIRQATEQKEQLTGEIQVIYDNLVKDVTDSVQQFDMQMMLTQKLIVITNSLHNDYNANTHAASLSRKLREIQMTPIQELQWEGDVFARQSKLIPIQELVGVIKAEKKVVPPVQQETTSEEGSEEDSKPGESAMSQSIDDIALRLELTKDKDILGMTMIYNLVHLLHKKDPTIYIYQPGGTLKTEVEVPGLVGPQAMTTINADQGRLAIVCSSKNNLHLLTLSRDHAIEDHSVTKLSYLPQDINFDPQGNRLLVGRMNNTINVFDLQGQAKETISCADVAWVQSALPIQGGYVVADHKSNQVVKCDEAGESLNRFKYQHPFGPFKQGNKTLVQDQNGHIFVCDAVNSGVHLLTSEGAFIPYLLTPKQGVKTPTCICLDEVSQYLYVANTDEETNHKEVSAYPYAKMLMLLNMPLTTCRYTMKLTINKVGV